MRLIKSLIKKVRNSLIKLCSKIHISTLDITLIIVVVLFVGFNLEMIRLYEIYGSMPETYACAVVVALIGECGICGKIFTTKIKYKEKQFDDELENKNKSNSNSEDDQDNNPVG